MLGSHNKATEERISWFDSRVEAVSRRLSYIFQDFSLGQFELTSEVVEK